MLLKSFKLSVFLLLCFCFMFNSCKSIKSTTVNTQLLHPAIIPLPAKLLWENKAYKVPKANTICFNDGGKVAASWLHKLLQSANIAATVTSGNNCGNWNITLNPSLKSSLGEEGYNLEITENGIQLNSGTKAGLLYAIQTLRQFFPAGIENQQLSSEQISLAQVSISDKPEYSWRGTMVDVARSFFDLKYLKHHVDRMALYKLNRLHLHLTDDQGWRIEIKSKPKLTQVSSRGSVTGGRSGYLTQEEYKELQDYALERNIIIIPEIDMPGHIYAALAAYPELNCENNSNINPKKATPPEPYSGEEVGWSKFCLKNPATYDFVSEVIGELSEITKGPWIHIGGDEIEDPLYKTFVVKADSIVRHYNKIAIGWEEVTQAKVSDSFISQQWNGKTESVVDVKVIESICSQFYFDHGNTPGQKDVATWCKKDGITIKEVYNFLNTNPMVIGVEAPVWTEKVHSNQAMDDRFWPRLTAVAEIAWTPLSKRDFSDFAKRLSMQGNRLGYMGVNFFQNPEIEWNNISKAEQAGDVFSNFSPGE